MVPGRSVEASVDHQLQDTGEELGYEGNYRDETGVPVQSDEETREDEGEEEGGVEEERGGELDTQTS